MRRTLIVSLSMATVAFIALLTTGCSQSGKPALFPTSDFDIQLPNGYQLIRTMPQDIALCDSRSIEIIAPTIDGYRVYSDAVVGHVTKHPDKSFGSVPGYFILDLKTGKVYQGLSNKDWTAQMRKYGIRSAPILHYPTAQDEARGFNRPNGP